MKFLCLMMLVSFAIASVPEDLTVPSSLIHIEGVTPKLQLPLSYKPYGELVERLSTPHVTLEDATKMVKEFPANMENMRYDRTLPHLRFLLNQQSVLKAEEARLRILRDANPGNLAFKKARFLVENMYIAVNDCSIIYEQKIQENERRLELIQKEENQEKKVALLSLHALIKPSHSCTSDYLMLNELRDAADFFALLSNPITDILPLHIHKLIFLTYISDLFSDIALIVNESGGVLHVLDDDKPFLEVFNHFLSKNGKPDGGKILIHALWMLHNHITFSVLPPAAENF